MLRDSYITVLMNNLCTRKTKYAKKWYTIILNLCKLHFGVVPTDSHYIETDGKQL